jgi:hypothetical protein
MIPQVGWAGARQEIRTRAGADPSSGEKFEDDGTGPEGVAFLEQLKVV